MFSDPNLVAYIIVWLRLELDTIHTNRHNTRIHHLLTGAAGVRGDEFIAGCQLSGP
jgi:hypothetical protein